MLEIITLPVLADNYIYLIHDPVSQETAAVDPALAQPVLDVLQEKGWQLTYILNTHHHSDHVGGNLQLKRRTDCKIIAAQADWDRIPGIDQGVIEGDVISLGQHKTNVISTPGHTRAHIVYHFAEDNLLFCGDTLFVMGCGRLFEGTAEQLWHSLQKLKALPKATKVYCTHEYTQTNGRFALTVEPDNPCLQQRMVEVNRLRSNNQPTVPTTIADELATNPFFREDSVDLQKTLGMINSQPVEVFAKVRWLKDSFSS
jgi:hydroxyacylglutathione hydrolase